MHSFESLLTRASELFGGRPVVSFHGRLPGDPVTYDICDNEDYITFWTRYALTLGRDGAQSQTVTLPSLCAQLAPEELDINAAAVAETTSLVSSGPVVPSAETDETLTEAQVAEDEVQSGDPVDTRIDEGDQSLTNDASVPDNTDNSHDIIYISDDSPDDEDGDANGQVPSASPSEDNADNSEHVDPGQGVLGHLRRLNSLPSESVPEFARMFCLDPSSITPETEKRLPGTRLPLRLPQLAYLFRVVTSARDHPDLRGHYNGDTMASGKTIATLARAVFTRTSQLIDDHIDNPHLHCPPDTDEAHSRCPLGDAFGIQCLCERDNPIRDFVGSTARGVDIQVCPKGLQQNWLEQWEAYVDTMYDEPNHPLHGEVVLHGYTIGDGHRLEPIDLASPPLLARELLLDVKLESDSKNAIKLQGTREPTTHSSTSQERGEAAWLLLTREKLSLDWANDGSQPSLWSGRSLKVYVKQKACKIRPVKVMAHAGLAPRSITFDEYNQYQGVGSNLHAATISICRRLQPGGQAAPWVYFLSGTPANKSVTDFNASYSIIQSDPEQRRHFENATRRLDRCRTAHSGASQEAETRAAMIAARDLISPWMTARGEKSPIANGWITVARSLTMRFELFDTPEEYKEAYEHLLRWAQEEIADELSFDIQKFGGTLGSLNLMLRGATLSGFMSSWIDGHIPWRGNDVRSDQQPEGEGLYESHIGEYTKHDEMFSALSDIIHNASRGIVEHERERQYTSTRAPLHAIPFTAFPAVAAGVFHYINKKCEAFAEAELVTAWHKPQEREGLISRLVERAAETRASGESKSIVVVTIFNVLSTGRNDLVFANIVLKLGEPWTNAVTEQAIGRIDRPGQRQPTFDFDFIRKDNEAEALVRARNRHRKVILSDNRLFNAIDSNASS
ncbi:hypothetical protein LRP88_07382 [Fusarium phalaenopsidis]